MAEPDFSLPVDPPFTPAELATIRIVKRLQDATAMYRMGAQSGLEVLDSASRLLPDTIDAFAGPRVDPRRMSKQALIIEVTIFCALAEVYGDATLTQAPLGYVLCLIARYGGIALVRWTLWGQTESDTELAVILADARALLTQISLEFSDAFLADATAVIAAYRATPRPRAPGTGIDVGGHD